MSTIYYQEKILKIEDNFKLELGKFCFKFNNNLLPNTFNQIYTNISAIHQYSTRNSHNRFFRNQHNKTSGYITLQHLGSKLWSNIPTNIKDSKSIHIFERKYKNLLMENYNYA